MEILTGDQMRRTDRRAIDEMGIPSLQLMEAAGRGIAEALLADYPGDALARLVILCGKGNNGGDGLVTARLLRTHGIDSRVILLASPGDLKGDAAHNYRAACDCGLDVTTISSGARAREAIAGSPIVLDAMLGTGFTGEARGLIAEVIGVLNESGCRVAAVDLPSGIDADQAAVVGPAVVAERTYTLCRPKIAFVQPPAANLCGSVRVIPIGIPDEAVCSEPPNLDWIDSDAVRSLLPVRSADSHKGTYGHLLAVAGSRGKGGAAVLLARGALRCGVGLITVATSTSCREQIAVQQAELMTESLSETGAGGLGPDAASTVLGLLSVRDALAIGPGLGTMDETRDAVRAIVAGCTSPTVIDADGLNALVGLPLKQSLPAGSRGSTVLTPHPGEAARLLDCTAAEVQSNRLEAVRQLAQTSEAVVVLKGSRSLVAAADGRVAVNSTGNPGMATGGTGDVLTGAIGAFLARGLTAWDAARLGLFVHGDAGDRAARVLGQESLIAGDVVDQLPYALLALGRAS